MKKLALAVAVAAISSQAMAVEIYNAEDASLEVYGEIRARLRNQSGESSEFDGQNTRIGIKGQYALGNDMYALGNVRMYGDYNSNDSASYDRGYVGLGHNAMGEIRFGKVASIHDDIFDYDISWVYGGNAMMGNDQFATDVASSAAQYEWNSDSLRVMAQYQTRTDTADDGSLGRDSRIDEGYSIGASWASDFGLGLTGAYTTVELVGLGAGMKSVDADTFGLEATYAVGNFSVAVAYFTQDVVGNNSVTKANYNTEATGVGANVRYEFDNGIGLYGVYDYVETTDSNVREAGRKQEVEVTTYTLGVDYWPHQQLVTFVEYAHEKDEARFQADRNHKNIKNDNIAIGARFYF